MTAEDQAGVSDWEDQDLLTVDLAAERLSQEIEALRRLIAGDTGGDLTAARARLEQLIEASDRLNQRST